MTHELSLATPGRPTLTYTLRYLDGQEVAALQAVADATDDGELSPTQCAAISQEIRRRLALQMLHLAGM